MLELIRTGLIQLPTPAGTFEELMPGCAYDVFGSTQEPAATTSSVNSSPVRGAHLLVPLRTSTLPRTEKVKIYMGQWTENYGRPTGSEKFYLQVQPPLNVEKVLDAARILHPEKIDWLLYSGDGCEIPDCSVTQDTSFWTNPSRKMYFMAPRAELEPPTRRRRVSSQPSTADQSASNQEMLELLTAVKADVAEMKERVLDKNIKISPDLAAIVQRTFKCLICLSAPIHSSPGYQECCRSIVGCFECLDGYYTMGRGQKSCPKCRAERGYAKLHEVLGMEEFFNGLQHLQDSPDNVDDGL